MRRRYRPRKVHRYECMECGHPEESWWAAWRRQRHERKHPVQRLPSLYGDLFDQEAMQALRAKNVFKAIEPTAYPMPVTFEFVNRPPITDEDGGRRGD